MIPISLQRATRRYPALALGLFGTFLMVASVGNAQSSYQITDSSGNIVPAASSLYTVSSSCYNAGGPPMPAQICTWVVRKLYGDNNPVVVVVDSPHATPPGCQYGATTQISSGYTRVNCQVWASAAVYGQ
jgi:hypothetical protein